MCPDCLNHTIRQLARIVRSQRQRLSAALAGSSCNHSERENSAMPVDLQPLTLTRITAFSMRPSILPCVSWTINGVPGLIALTAVLPPRLRMGTTAGLNLPVTDLGDALKTKATALASAVASASHSNTARAAGHAVRDFP